MAYTTGKTSALQTATKAGVDIALAELAAGIIDPPTHEAIMARVQEVKDSLTPELFSMVDADNALAAAQPQQKSYPSKGGGSPKAAGAPTLEEAKSAVLNFGMFKGMTMESVCAMTSDEVKAYTNGKRDGGGVKYIQWLAGSQKPEQAWAQARAKLVLDDWQAVGNTLAVLAGK